MTTLKSSQSGIAHLALLLLLVILVVAGFVGYRVLNEQTKVADSPDQATPVTAPDSINNSSDLDQASQAANQAPLDNDLDPSQFDPDVESLL